jgi:hypothetical protein
MVLEFSRHGGLVATAETKAGAGLRKVGASELFAACTLNTSVPGVITPPIRPRGPKIIHDLTLTEPFKMPTVHLLDYVAGNVRSLVNAIEKVGYTVEWVKSPADVPSADV